MHSNNIFLEQYKEDRTQYLLFVADTQPEVVNCTGCAAFLQSIFDVADHEPLNVRT